MNTRVAIVVFLVVGGVSGSCRTACGDEPRPPADPLKSIREAAKTADLHGICVYRALASTVRVREIEDVPRLNAALRAKRGPAAHVWLLLSKKVQATLADDRPEKIDQLNGLLVSDLNTMIERPDFYLPKAFEKAAVGEDLKALIDLGDKRTPIQTRQMNRDLLTAAFPGVIGKTPPDYNIVRVRVTEGANTVLFLSSYSMCRWELDIAKGATVKGVILAGHDYQEVAGTTAPVFYRAVLGADGKPIKGNEKLLWARDEKDKLFPALAADIKEIVGKELTHYQGSYNAPKEPFVVKPSAK